jgi:hypothetical protein
VLRVPLSEQYPPACGPDHGQCCQALVVDWLRSGISKTRESHRWTSWSARWQTRSSSTYAGPGRSPCRDDVGRSRRESHQGAEPRQRRRHAWLGPSFVGTARQAISTCFPLCRAPPYGTVHHNSNVSWGIGLRSPFRPGGRQGRRRPPTTTAPDMHPLGCHRLRIPDRDCFRRHLGQARPPAAHGTSQPGPAGQVRPRCAAGAANGWPPGCLTSSSKKPSPVTTRSSVRTYPRWPSTAACTKPRAVVKGPAPTPRTEPRSGGTGRSRPTCSTDPHRLGHRRSEPQRLHPGRTHRASRRPWTPAGH